MKNSISIISITVFLLSVAASCQKQWEMIAPKTPITDELGPEAWEKGVSSLIFVTAYGTGDQDGSSWDNSMDAVGLRDLLTSQNDLSGAMIAVAEGTYYMSETAGYGPTVNKNIGMIQGGYSKYSTGTDLTQWDPATHRTIFSGDVNENGKADEGDCGLMYITGGQVNISNIEFENGYITDKLAAAIQAQSPGIGVNGTSPSSTAINLTQCSFSGCNSQAVTNGNNAGGTAIKVTSGYARARECTFTNCKTSSRGGAIRTMTKNAVVFLDKCKLFDNAIDSQWGGAIQLSQGHLCVNNCTIYGNKANGAQVNGGGSFFISNSTIIGTDTDTHGCLRLETSVGDQAFFINNLLFSTGTGNTFTKNVQNSEIISKGFNIYEKESNGSYGTMVILSDKKITSKPVGTYKDNLFVCDPGQFSLTSTCGIDDVIAAIDQYNPQNTTLSNLGTEFKDWVGVEGFGVDQRGYLRGEDSFQPGAYDDNAAAPNSVIKVSPYVGSHQTKSAMTSADLSSFRMIINNPVSAASCYNVMMMKQSGKWAPQGGGVMCWDKDKNPVTIIGLSPFNGTATATSSITVSVLENQSADTGVKSSDFLLSKSTVDPKQLGGNPVSLEFKHLFAKLGVTIKDGTTVIADSDLDNVTIADINKSATINLSEDAPSPVPTSSQANISLHREGTYYEGILIPQTAKLTVSFKYKGNNYSWTSSSNVEMLPSYEYSLELTVSNTKTAGGIVSAIMR